MMSPDPWMPIVQIARQVPVGRFILLLTLLGLFQVLRVDGLAAEVRTFPNGAQIVTAEDITAEAPVLFRAMRFNEVTEQWNVDLVVTNRGDRAFANPLFLLIDGFSNTPGPIRVDGATIDGVATSFWRLDNGGSLAPGKLSRVRTVSLGYTEGARAPQLRLRVFGLPAGLQYALGLTRSLNEVGHPLPSTRVIEQGPGGSRTRFTDPDQGVVTLGGGFGEYTWRFERDGYFPAWRRDTLSLGAVRLIPNPRLVPRSTDFKAIVPDETNVVQSVDGTVRMTFLPELAATSPPALAVIGLDGQTLPGLLPRGWSPVRAFWIETTNNLPLPAPVPTQLKPNGTVSSGETGALAVWNPTNVRWDVRGLLRGEGTNAVNLTIAGPGAYAWVVADEGVLAPPAPVAGAPLQASTPPAQAFPTFSASGAVLPQTSPASREPGRVTATASVRVTNSTGVLPSGLTLRAEVTESYRLQDASARFVPSSETFLTAYRRGQPNVAEPDAVAGGPGFDVTPASALQMAFPMRPHLLFGPEELAGATVRVEVLPPDRFNGTVLDVDGGVLTEGRIKLTLRPNPATEPNAATLRLLVASNFNSLLPANASGAASSGVQSILAAFELVLAPLVPEERFTLAVANLPARRDYILARVRSNVGYQGLEPVERLRTDAKGTLVSLEPADSPRLIGARASGQYVLVQVTQPHGLIAGTIRGAGGEPQAGVPVRVSNLPWLSLSDVTGTYRLVAPTGAVEVVATDLTSNDSDFKTVTVAEPAARVALELSVRPRGPRVVTVTPADGARNVSRVSPITVTFSQPLNPGSVVGDGLRLLGTNGLAVAASLTLNPRGTVATLLPANPLGAGQAFRVLVSSNVADLLGRKIEGATEFRFTVAAETARGDVAKLTIFEPGATNLPQNVRNQLIAFDSVKNRNSVVAAGSPGTAEAEVPVILVNGTSGETSTVLSKPDGSFFGFVRADVEDFVSAVFVNANGTRTTVAATEQRFDDGRIGLYRAGGILEAESDGAAVQVIVSPDAIQERAVFKVQMQTLAELLNAAKGVAPQDAKLLLAFRFEVQGDVPKAGIDVSFPMDPQSLQLPPGEDPEEAALGLLIPEEVEGVTAYRLVDKMRFKDGKVFSNTSPFPGIVGALLGEILSFNTTLALFGGKPVVVSGHAVELKVPMTEFAAAFPATPPSLLGAMLTGGFFGNFPGVTDAIEDLLTQQNSMYFRPASGVFVFASPLNTQNAAPGRIQAGAVYATTDRHGLYALALPVTVGEAAVPFAPVPGYRLVGSHPRYRQRLTEGLSFSEIGISQGQAPFFRRNLIFAGPLANGSPTPSLRVEAALQPATPATNQPAQLRGIAFTPNGSPELAIKVEAAVSTVAGQTVEISEVKVENVETHPLGTGVTELTATVTCARAAQALLRVGAALQVNGGTLTNSAVILVRFGESEPPLPDSLTSADPDDKTGPGVLRANVTDGGMLPPDGRIVIQFSEPVNRLSVKRANAIVITPAPVSPPAIFLSADQQTLEIYPGLFAASVEQAQLSLTSTIRDLADRGLDQVPGLPGEQTYGLTFRLPVTRRYGLNAMANGGGVVSHRGFLYALERGSPTGIRIYRTDDVLIGNGAPAGFIPLIGQPRDLVLIRDWPHKRSLSDAQVRQADLLAVVGGDAGSKELDEGGNVFFGGQFLRVFDLSNPVQPERILGAMLTLRNTVVNRLVWHPPHLGYIESGSDLQEVALLNLQAMMVGFNGTSSEVNALPLEKFDGLDLNGNGSFVQEGEQLPTPERRPFEFFGKDAHFVLTGAGLFQDVAVARGFVGAVATGGRDPVNSQALPTLPSYRTLRANGESLPDNVGVLMFGGAARPKRLTVLLDELMLVNGQQQRRSVALVTMAPDADGKNKVVIVDLFNPSAPVRTADAIELPTSFGIPQSIIRREDGLLGLATSTHLVLLDPAHLMEPAPGGVGTAGQAELLHPAVLTVIPQAGSGNRTLDSDPTGVNVVNLGARHEVIQSAPRLSFVIFPTLATAANASALVGNDAALGNLFAGLRRLTGIPLARLSTKGGAFSSVAQRSPLVHSHVLIECPGGAGAQLSIAIESLNAGGYALKSKGKDFPPVRTVSSETLSALRQDPGSTGGTDPQTGQFRSPVTSLRAFRLSSSPSSRFYNFYLSDPFALIRERATLAQIQELSEGRPILWSGHSLRASLDSSLAGNSVIGAFADQVDSVGRIILPGAFVIAETLPGSYIPGDNPPPPGAEVSFPGTFGLVSSLNGELRATEVDVTLPSRRMPIVFQRTLAGQDLTDGPFGPGWNFNYNQHLVEFKPSLFPPGSKAPVVVRQTPQDSTIAEFGDVQFDDGEGHVILFKNRGETVPAGVQGDPLAQELGWFEAGGRFYVPDENTKNVFDLLYRHPVGEFCRLTSRGVQFWYAKDGRLLRVKDKHLKNTHELTYNSRGELYLITDMSVQPTRTLEIGRYRMDGDTQFDLDEITDSAFVAGQICALRDFTGRVTTYKYLPTGILDQVLRPETDSTAMSSEGEKGFRGRPVTRYLYSSAGQSGFRGVTEGNGANSSGGGGNSGTPLFVATLGSSGGKPVATGGTGAGGTVALNVPEDNSAETGPNASGNLGQRADQSKARFSFDAYGQPSGVSQTGPEADESNTGIVYHQEPELRGLVKSITGPEGDTITFEYFNGSLIRSKPNIRKITRTAGPRGGPEITSSFTSYDPRYNLPTGPAKNANGKTVTYTLTGDKKELSSVDYGNGAVMAWTYNEYGQPLTESTPDGVTQTWVPNTDSGYLESKSIGAVTTGFSYDSSVAGKLGQPTTIQLPRGASISVAYDTRLLPLKQTRGSQESLHAYDENGNEVLMSVTVDSGLKREKFATYNQVNFLTSTKVKGVEADLAGATEDLETTFVPDPVFRVAEAHLPSGETQEFKHDHLGRIIKLAVGGRVQEWSYDLNGNLRKTKLSTASTLGLGPVQETTYDGHDRPLTVKRPGADGTDEVTTLTYFNGGELKTRKTTHPTGTVEDIEVMDVDGYGRPLSVTQRGNSINGDVTYSYTVGNGLTVVQTGPNDTVTRVTDTAGRLKRISDSLADRTFMVNDSFQTEKVSSVENGTTYETTFTYNDLDQLKEVSDGVGRIASLTPRLDGLSTRTTDDLGQDTFFKYSKLGELLRKDRLQSLRTDYAFDKSRRPSAVVDRDGKGHAYFYEDGRLRMTRQKLRNGAEIKLNSPNVFNLPQATVLPGGGEVAHEYDGQGRQTKAETAFNGTTYVFEGAKHDAAGRVRAIDYETHSGDDSSATFTYDKLGSLTLTRYEEAGGPYTIEHGIREDGARTSLEYPSGVVVNEEREDNGRLKRISVTGDSAPIWEVTSFAGATEPVAITRGPLSETRAYDLRRRLVACIVTRTSGSAVLEDWRYVWDAANNLRARQAVHEQGRAETYSYDSANRLKTVQFGLRPSIEGEAATPVPGLASEQNLRPGYASRSYTYDGGGLDLLTDSTVIDTDMMPRSLAPFARNIGAHDSFLFPRSVDGFDRGAPDELGNTAKIRHPMLNATGQFTTQTATLTHNGRNELIKASRGGTEFFFHYRPDGLLHRKVAKAAGGETLADRALVWDGALLLEEYDLLSNPSRLVARYYYADGDTPVAADFADAGGNLRRYHLLHDHLMSVTAVVDGATTQVVERMHYDPWGHSLVELQDTAAPRVERVFEEASGSLLFVFSEAVLPAPNVPATGLATTASGLDGLFSVMQGGSTVNGQVAYVESAGGLPFGAIVRFTPSGNPSGSLSVTVNAGRVFDSWGNPNPNQPFQVPLLGFAGERFQSGGGSTRPRTQAISAVGNPFRFQGQYAELDLGLIYMRARFFDPHTGQFLQLDPSEYEDSVNLYAGFAQNPVSLRDPTGKATAGLFSRIFGGAGRSSRRELQEAASQAVTEGVQEGFAGWGFRRARSAAVSPKAGEVFTARGKTAITHNPFEILRRPPERFGELGPSRLGYRPHDSLAFRKNYPNEGTPYFQLGQTEGGYKLHITAEPDDVEIVARTAQDILRRHGIDHKIVVNEARYISGFSAGKNQQGKLITVYLPGREREARRAMENTVKLLEADSAEYLTLYHLRTLGGIKPGPPVRLRRTDPVTGGDDYSQFETIRGSTGFISGEWRPVGEF